MVATSAVPIFQKRTSTFDLISLDAIFLYFNLNQFYNVHPVLLCALARYFKSENFKNSQS